MKKILALLALILLALGACENTGPRNESDDAVPFAGDFEPSSGEFTLKTLDSHDPDRRFARVALIGRNLVVDASSSTVSIDVAIHNLSERSLYPELIVWLEDFRPPDVMPQNADLLPPPQDTLPAQGPWGYRYDQLVGEDDLLEPQEMSEFRTWIFYDPGLLPFRFAAHIQFASTPGAARLAGAIFNDVDLDGEFDADEPTLGAGHVFVDAPGGESSVLPVKLDGHYEMYVEEPGLYTARYLPPPSFGFAPLFMTTPNPLQILIPAGPDGSPIEYLDAHFGIASGDAYPFPVEFSELTPAELPSDPFQLIDLAILEELLVAELGISGCSPGHPVRLIMSGDFEFDASGGPIAQLVLVHDDLDELCDAWFQVRRPFNLMPLVYRYHDQFGRFDEMLLRIHLPSGAVEEIRYDPPRPER